MNTDLYLRVLEVLALQTGGERRVGPESVDARECHLKYKLRFSNFPPGIFRGPPRCEEGV